MEAFSIHVSHSDKLNFHNWSHFEKNQLYVSVNGRFVHAIDGVCLLSKELAEQYKDAIKARRIKFGDKEFDAEVVSVSSSYPNFSKSVMNDSEIIRKKLEKWNYPTPQNIIVDESGWVIHVKHEDQKQASYLMTLSKDNTIRLCSNKNDAKTYKSESFVQKALKEINKSPKLRAFATKVE
jgi:hypothetical protein